MTTIWRTTKVKARKICSQSLSTWDMSMKKIHKLFIIWALLAKQEQSLTFSRILQENTSRSQNILSPFSGHPSHSQLGLLTRRQKHLQFLSQRPVPRNLHWALGQQGQQLGLASKQVCEDIAVHRQDAVCLASSRLFAAHCTIAILQVQVPGTSIFAWAVEMTVT